MTTATRKMTAEEFEVYAASHGRCELVRGEVRDLSPSGGTHGRLVMKVGAIMVGFAHEHGLGEVVGGEVGFRLADVGGASVRAPDIAFIAKSRAAAINAEFITVPPDLVIEILSPGDRASEVNEKVRWWLDHGARAVWVMDPESIEVAAHFPGGRSQRFGEGDTLTGGEVLPGFEVKLEELFR